MKRDSESAKSNNEFTVKLIAISLFIVLSVVLVLQGCYPENENANKIDIAVKEVGDLFEVEDEEKIKEGESSKIKDSTDQEQINEALEAVNKIDTSGGEQNENDAIAFSLQSAILNAQLQLKEREGTLDSSDNNAQDEQKGKEFHPNEDDVVLKNNELKNKDILEEFKIGRAHV